MESTFIGGIKVGYRWKEYKKLVAHEYIEKEEENTRKKVKGKKKKLKKKIREKGSPEDRGQKTGDRERKEKI